MSKDIVSNDLRQHMGPAVCPRCGRKHWSAVAASVHARQCMSLPSWDEEPASDEDRRAPSRPQGER